MTVEEAIDVNSPEAQMFMRAMKAESERDAAEARAKRLEDAIREVLDNYLDVLPIHVRLILQEAAPPHPPQEKQT
jgi:hypothetical protein